MVLLGICYYDMERFEGMLAILSKCSAVDVCVIGVAVLIVVLLFQRKRRWKIRKMPASDTMLGFQLIYADQKSGKKESDFGKLLYSAEFELQGKPDYIFRQRITGQLVPMELKSGFIRDKTVPHHGDLLQLGAYFLIIEDVYGRRPKYGTLVYQDYMFVVKNTRSLRQEIQKTTKQMREMLRYGNAKANNSFANCRFCICNGTVCKYSDTEIVGGNEDGTSGREE